MEMISQKTLKALEDLSKVGNELIVNEDNQGYIAISGPNHHLFGFYDLPEEERDMPEFALTDLSQFVQIVKALGKIKRVIFKAESIELQTSHSGIKYWFASKDLIKKSVRKVEKSTFVSEFILSSATLKSIFKMSSLLNCDILQFVTLAEKNTVLGVLEDITSPTSHVQKEVIGINLLKNSHESTVAVKIEDLRINMNYDYKVSIDDREVIRMIALEHTTSPDSKTDVVKENGLSYYVLGQSEVIF